MRVHPQILAGQRLPPRLVGKKVWDQRLEDIAAYERYLARNGFAILKFFLNVSKKEQKRRFLERLDEPEKHWKFSHRRRAGAGPLEGLHEGLRGGHPGHRRRARPLVRGPGRREVVHPARGRGGHRGDAGGARSGLPQGDRRQAGGAGAGPRRSWRRSSPGSARGRRRSGHAKGPPCPSRSTTSATRSGRPSTRSAAPSWLAPPSWSGRAGRIIYCNIGNPQSLGQKPLTFVRQVLALGRVPGAARRAGGGGLPGGRPGGGAPGPAREPARPGRLHREQGLPLRPAGGGRLHPRAGRHPRRPGARLPHRRRQQGGAVGAAPARRRADRRGDDPHPAVPALLGLHHAARRRRRSPTTSTRRGTGASRRQALESAHAEAAAKGIRVRAIAVINPGNPTGAVLDESNVEMVLDFARAPSPLGAGRRGLPGERLPAGRPLRLLRRRCWSRRGIIDVPLFSFHSVSKGFLGECGHRGGYLECRNVPPDVMARGGEAPVGGAVRQLGGAARHLDHGPASPLRRARPSPSSTGSGARCSTR